MAFPIRLAYQCLLYGNNHVLDKIDNRELTRYFDGVINVCNDFGWQKLNQQYIFFILLGLYIRKMLSPIFLNIDVILQKQKQVDDYCNTLTPEQTKYVMPYYDYLKLFLGVDRENPPEEFKQLYGWSGSHIAEFSWAFNETVYYSLGKSFGYNELRRFYNQPMVIPENCQELCRLIILYGGEQENARDER